MPSCPGGCGPAETGLAGGRSRQRTDTKESVEEESGLLS